jgi:hypothetical protein
LTVAVEPAQATAGADFIAPHLIVGAVRKAESVYMTIAQTLSQSERLPIAANLSGFPQGLFETLRQSMLDSQQRLPK